MIKINPETITSIRKCRLQKRLSSVDDIRRDISVLVYETLLSEDQIIQRVSEANEADPEFVTELMNEMVFPVK